MHHYMILMLKVMVSAGDSVMYRIYYYVKPDNFHMAE